MNWFYAQEGQHRGPVNDAELAHLAGAGAIDGSTLVWNEGLPGWRPYAVVAPRFQPNAANALPYAGFWRRAAAVFLDLLILYPVTAIVFFALFLGFPDFLSVLDDQAAGTRAVFPLVLFVTGALYETIFEGDGGATPGKIICNLRVVQSDGDGLSYSGALGRYFAKILSAASFGLGFVIVAFDSEKRGLHDYICSTRVIHARPSAD